MKTSQFSFDLPEEQIAQEPSADRESDRLLVLDRSSGAVTHSFIRDLAGWIEPGTVMVLNDSRVRKARVFATRPGGASVEILLLERHGVDLWEAMVGRGRRLKPGTTLELAQGVSARLDSGNGERRILRFDPPIDEAWLERNGHVPLPPYIKRPDRASDQQWYQTVYAREVGSAAAPTAGLHLTIRLLDELRAKGVKIVGVTLHVGMGTFLPIRSGEIEGHIMHEEAYYVPPETKAIVDEAMHSGRGVLAVGTTVVRTLESAWQKDGLRTGSGKTKIYITPGYDFKVVRKLITNFHTPRSSLLVLVSAFAGRERILSTYAVAIKRGYRFFSYGDAMMIL